VGWEWEWRGEGGSVADYYAALLCSADINGTIFQACPIYLISAQLGSARAHSVQFCCTLLYFLFLYTSHHVVKSSLQYAAFEQCLAAEIL